MYQYEHFIMEAFPKIRAVCDFSSGITDELDMCRKRATRFLEMNCTAVYGFPDEVHCSENGGKSVGMIPGIYYSAFLLPILNEERHLNQSVTSTISNILLTSRGKSGLWNFIMNVDDRVATLFPDDIDCSALSIIGLFKTGHLELEDCRSTLLKLLENSIEGPNGEIGTWLCLDKSEEDRPILYKSILKNPRVDAGSMANALWCLANFGLDSLPRLIPSVKFIGNFIDKLIDTEGSTQEIEGMLYYTNRDFIYFLISRYVSVSTTARNAFGTKFGLLVKRELIGFKLSNETKALNAASIVLAAILLKIHQLDGESGIRDRNDITEIRAKIIQIYEAFPSLQNPDGSFPAWKVYNWYRIGEYAGSQAFSTSIVLSALSKVKQEFF